MNGVYSPFYPAKLYSGLVKGRDKWQPVLVRVAMLHCLIMDNKPASRRFLQWSPQSLPRKSGGSRGAWRVFSSPVSSLPGGKDADSVGLMPSVFCWVLLLVSMQNKGSENTTPASLLMAEETLVISKQLPELYLAFSKCSQAGSWSR